jgi:hypothetical protein
VLPDDRLFGNTGAQYGDKYRDHVLEQYKLYVEMTDRNTQRRIAATSSDVLLVSNTLIAALAAAGDRASTIGFRTFPTVVLGITGVLLCLAWAQRVQRYKSLGQAKFQVLHAVEDLLPLRLYEMEWEILAKGVGSRRYAPGIDLDFLMPRLFAALHLALIAVAVI